MVSNLKLGFTKIGDLLLRNKITCVDNDVIENMTLTIPPYQRPYKWTVKNSNQLLEDIREAKHANKETYRVGTLILHHDKNGNYNIVDGQQRTITFVLLLHALGKSDINFLKQKVSHDTDTIHNVMNNLRAFERQLKKISDERDKKIIDEKDKETLADYISENCELIVIITEDQSEAFQFFDSQNARGKALYPHDLLKAYHLREMNSLEVSETEKIVKTWEELDQRKLAGLFNEYLYRLKEWVRGNRAEALTEHNIELFKGVTSRDNHPYAQYYKGAFAFAENLNRSYMPFVTGIQKINPFQIDAPIIAGKPFFEYARHYFYILTDIQNNDKYEGYFINDNEIVKTLDQRIYRNGVGNSITRLMFDTAILLYVDRFCPVIPSKIDKDYLEQFVVYAFIWAYSMRAQHVSVGWQTAQNYIMGKEGVAKGKDGIVNSFNIYKTIAESDSPNALLNKMADLLSPLNKDQVKTSSGQIPDIDEKNEDDEKIYKCYLHFFKVNNYWEEK